MKKFILKSLVGLGLAAAMLTGCSVADISIDKGGAYDRYDAVAPGEASIDGGAYGDVSGDPYDGGETGENPQQPFPSGVVTAAEWNDVANWSFWANLLNNQDWAKYESHWKYYPHNFAYVETTDTEGKPVCGVPVVLMKDGQKVWKAVSDNSGKVVLWTSLYDADYKIDAAGYTIVADGKEYSDVLFTTPNKSELQVNKVLVKTNKVDNAIDVAFIVDATGSMGDEIGFLKADLEDIVKLVGQQCTATVRTGTVFYRDEGDEYVTKYSQFTTSVKETVTYIGQQRAEGGGDWPEAVHMALETGIQKLQWNDDARSRVAFLILDAPPHHEDAIIASCQKSIEAYAASGIKVIPVAASGIDKACEFLLRSFALSTNGTYVFITNDSGVGDMHIEATVGQYEVEKLRDLIARLIIAYAK